MKNQIGIKEMKKALIIENWINQNITGAQAAEQLQISYRQLKRLKRIYLKDGALGFRHRNLSRSPFNKLGEELTKKVIEVFMDWKRNTDDGVNSSHLTDILLEHHGIKISRQTSWRILKNHGLHVRTRRVRKYRKRRERREQMGDILYLDGSPHRWLGEKQPKLTLILCIDDATSSALWGTFVPDENRNACFEVAYHVFTKFGLPMNFWLDRASQFITTRGSGVVNPQSELPTHWQNAMYNLGIRNIFAHSPQARGRGERANGTFQDRLCAELQYRNITDAARATFFLNEVFIPNYNKRFAVQPQNPVSLWRKLPEGIDLKKILCARTERRVQNDNTVKHNGKKYQILKKPGESSWAGIKIEVQDWFDGSVHLVSKRFKEIAYQEIASTPRYKRIEGLKKNTIIADIYRSTYF